MYLVKCTTAVVLKQLSNEGVVERAAFRGTSAGMRMNVAFYADIEYFGIVHKDAEFANGKWYFMRRGGRRQVSSFQSRAKVLNEPRAEQRHQKPLLRRPQ